MSRCEAGPGGKRVALSQPGWWALESCASANPEEGSTSHSHWEKHKHHLFYIKSVRLNKEANNLQHLRWHFSQIWPSLPLIMLVKVVFKQGRGTQQAHFAKKFFNLHLTKWSTLILNEMCSYKYVFFCLNKPQSIFIWGYANLYIMDMIVFFMLSVVHLICCISSPTWRYWLLKNSKLIIIQ